MAPSRTCWIVKISPPHRMRISPCLMFCVANIPYCAMGICLRPNASLTMMQGGRFSQSCYLYNTLSALWADLVSPRRTFPSAPRSGRAHRAPHRRAAAARRARAESDALASRSGCQYGTARDRASADRPPSALREPRPRLAVAAASRGAGLASSAVAAAANRGAPGSAARFTARGGGSACGPGRHRLASFRALRMISSLRGTFAMISMREAIAPTGTWGGL